MFDKVRFKSAVVLSKHTMAEVAMCLGINESTLYRKINNNGLFTREEINTLIGFLKIKDPFDIFFTNELA